MFDVFKTWRLDSGDYVKIAELVVSAWEGRCEQLDQHGAGDQGIARQRPVLMHSNLKDVEHVKQVAKWVQLPFFFIRLSLHLLLHEAMPQHNNFEMDRNKSHVDVGVNCRTSFPACTYAALQLL